MPIYEYLCSKCKLKFELRCSIKEAGKSSSCPKCQGSASRVFSSFAFFSKGETEGIAPTAGMGTSRCSGCTSTSCATCH